MIPAPRLLGVVAIAAAVIAASPFASARGTRAGDVTVVSGEADAKRVSNGGSSTPFALQLPSGAACPGDSANDGYRVQSFLVPSTDDPGSLTYFSVSPRGEGRLALYDVATNPFVSGQTADHDAPGGPGVITNLPVFSFAVFTNGEVHAGTYHMGIACTAHNDVVRFWSVDVALEIDSADQPAHLRWHLAAAPAAHDGLDPGAVVLALGAGTAAAVAVALIRRRQWRRIVEPARRNR